MRALAHEWLLAAKAVSFAEPFFIAKAIKIKVGHIKLTWPPDCFFAARDNIQTIMLLAASVYIFALKWLNA